MVPIALVFNPDNVEHTKLTSSNTALILNKGDAYMEVKDVILESGASGTNNCVVDNYGRFKLSNNAIIKATNANTITDIIAEISTI